MITARPSQKNADCIPVRSIKSKAMKGMTAPEKDIPAVANPIAFPRFIINQLFTTVLATMPP